MKGIHVILDGKLGSSVMPRVRMEEIKGYRCHDHTFSWVSLYSGRSFWRFVEDAIQSLTSTPKERVLMFESLEAAERHIELHDLEDAHAVKLTKLLEGVEL